MPIGSFPTAREGGQVSASGLQRMGRAIQSLGSVIGNSAMSVWNTAAGLILRPRRPLEFHARLDGSQSIASGQSGGNCLAYAWTQVYSRLNSAGCREWVVGGLSGTTTVHPAFEWNDLEVADSTIVWMTQGNGEFFNFDGGGKPAGGSNGITDDVIEVCPIFGTISGDDTITPNPGDCPPCDNGVPQYWDFAFGIAVGGSDACKDRWNAMGTPRLPQIGPCQWQSEIVGDCKFVVDGTSGTLLLRWVCQNAQGVTICHAEWYANAPNCCGSKTFIAVAGNPSWTPATIELIGSGGTCGEGGGGGGQPIPPTNQVQIGVVVVKQRRRRMAGEQDLGDPVCETNPDCDELCDDEDDNYGDGDDVTGCQGHPVLPATYRATINGATNNDCTNCAYLNATHDLAYGSGAAGSALVAKCYWGKQLRIVRSGCTGGVVEDADEICGKTANDGNVEYWGHMALTGGKTSGIAGPSCSGWFDGFTFEVLLYDDFYGPPFGLPPCVFGIRNIVLSVIYRQTAPWNAFGSNVMQKCEPPDNIQVSCRLPDTIVVEAA